MVVASISWIDGLWIVAGLTWVAISWWLVIAGSMWGMRRLLECTRPRVVVWVGVVATPVVMVGGGWIVYGIYRLARATDSSPTSVRHRALGWVAAALGSWAFSAAIAETFAVDLETYPQPGAQTWVAIFRWALLVPLLAGLLVLAVSAARGGRGWRLAQRFAQGTFWGALALLALVVPKPN